MRVALLSIPVGILFQLGLLWPTALAEKLFIGAGSRKIYSLSKMNINPPAIVAEHQ